MLIQHLRLWPLKKHHQHKLQLVSTTSCASGIAPLNRKETPQVQGANVRRQGAKFRASINASQYRMQQQQHATIYIQPPPPPTRSGHDAAVNTPCIRAGFVGEMVGPNASCISHCAVLVLIWLVVVAVRVQIWSMVELAVLLYVVAPTHTD